MGLGQGVKKAAGGDGLGAALGAAVEAQDGASPAVPRGSSWGGGCLGMPACRSWLRSETKGVPQAAASSKKQPVPMALKNFSQPSLTERTASVQLRELDASVGCMCPSLCIWEALWERSIEAPATCSWVGKGRAAGTAEGKVEEAEREALGQWRSPARTRSCGESCVSAHPCHASPNLCLPPSPSWALWLSKVFCSSANTALSLVAFYISFLCLSLSGSPPVTISFFLHCLLPPFLGRLQFQVSLHLCLFSVTPSALLPITFPMPFPWDYLAPFPMFNFLPVWPVPCCFLNLLLVSTFNWFPVRVFYFFLPVLYFIAFWISFHLCSLSSLFLGIFFLSLLNPFAF